MNQNLYLHELIFQHLLDAEIAITEETFTANVRQREVFAHDAARKKHKTEHAMNLIANEACTMVGRGHTQPGMPRAPKDIRPFNRALLLQLLNNPVKF